MFRMSNHMGFGVIPKLMALSVFDSATSTASTIVAPASIVPGDLIVLFDSAVSTGTPSTVTPTGFTNINTVTVGTATIRKSICSYKIAVGDEGGATITGMNGNQQNGKMIYVFRGNVAITSVVVGDVGSQGTDGDPVAQTITSASGIPPLVVFGAYAGGTAVSPRTFTVGGSSAKDGEITSSTSAYLAYKIYDSAPSDVVVDMEDETVNNTLQSFYLQAA